MSLLVLARVSVLSIAEEHVAAALRHFSLDQGVARYAVVYEKMTAVS